MTSVIYNFTRRERLSDEKEISQLGWKDDELIYKVINGNVVHPMSLFAQTHRKTDHQILQEIERTSWNGFLS